MRTLFSFCLVLFSSLFILDCSQKESSLVAPEETTSLSKGKGGGQPISYYEVTGDITGNGPRDNITLDFSGPGFSPIIGYFGAGNTSKTGIAYNARSHNDPIFVFYFDYLEEVGGYQGKFRCEGNFGKKEPMVYDGAWTLDYWLDYDEKVTFEGEGAEFTVVETIYRGNDNR